MTQSTSAAPTPLAGMPLAPPAAPVRPIQHALTLVMPIRSTADAGALAAMLQQIQHAPPGMNPIARALDTLQTVHFARFVFMEANTRLAVITTYDGSFETYINDFIDAIGDVFNALLAHIGDAPPLPVQQHRAEFLAYAQSHDLGCVEPLYSAYPTATALDIRAALAP